MKICNVCKRFVSDAFTSCIYCQNSDLRKISNLQTFKRVPYYSELILNNKSYSVKRLIGQGGFGSVIEIEETSTKKRYALKIPLSGNRILLGHTHLNDEQIVKSEEMLAKEIALLKEINHPGIISIVADGIWETFYKGQNVDIPYYIMELAETDLETLIAKTTKVALNEKLKIIKQLSSALAFLHRSGVVYRDLSLKNILVIDRNRHGIHYVLTDFGTYKKMFGFTVGQKSQIVGTTRYICPSYFRDNEKYRKDPRIDVYSLGVVATEVLLWVYDWTTLIDQEGFNPVLYHFADDLIPSLVNTGRIQKEIAEVLKKATAFEAEKRYSDAGEFLDAFENALASLDMQVQNTPTVFDEKINTFSKQQTPQKPIAYEIPFQLTVKLPLNFSKKTAIMKRIEFKDRTIHLSDPRGAEIVLPKCSKPPIIKHYYGPSFFDVIPSKHNAIILSLSQENLKKTLKPLLELDSSISGELIFKGKIKVEA